MKQPKNTKLYMHQPTGNIAYYTDKQAKAAGPDWNVVKFVKNEQGERVMRFSFKGADGVVATVDVQENKEVQANGEPVTK